MNFRVDQSSKRRSTRRVRVELKSSSAKTGRILLIKISYLRDNLDSTFSQGKGRGKTSTFTERSMTMNKNQKKRFFQKIRNYLVEIEDAIWIIIVCITSSIIAWILWS